MNWSRENISNVEHLLSTDLSNGLTTKIAASRLKEEGKNIRDSDDNGSVFHALKDLFFDVSHFPLLFAIIMSFSYRSYVFGTLALCIWMLLIATYTLFFINARKKIELAKNFYSSCVLVLRDGKERIVSSKNLVRGDILILQAGDMIPCDAYIVHAQRLEVDETYSFKDGSVTEKSAQTTEAEIDQYSKMTNLLFANSKILSGTCRAVCIRTGKFVVAAQENMVPPLTKREEPIFWQQLKKKTQPFVYSIMAFGIFVVFLGFLYGSEFVFSSLFLGTIFISSLIPAFFHGLSVIYYGIYVDSLRRRKKARALIKNPSLIDSLMGVRCLILNEKSLRNQTFTPQSFQTFLSACVKQKIKPIIFSSAIQFEQYFSFENTRVFDCKNQGFPLDNLNLLDRYDCFIQCSESQKISICQTLKKNKIKFGLFIEDSESESIVNMADVVIGRAQSEDFSLKHHKESYHTRRALISRSDLLVDEDLVAITDTISFVSGYRKSARNAMSYLMMMFGIRALLVIIGAFYQLSFLPLLPFLILNFTLDPLIVHHIWLSGTESRQISFLPNSDLSLFYSIKRGLLFYIPAIVYVFSLWMPLFLMRCDMFGYNIQAMALTIWWSLICVSLLYARIKYKVNPFREFYSQRILLIICAVACVGCIPYICTLFDVQFHWLSPIVAIISALAFLISFLFTNFIEHKFLKNKYIRR